MIALINFRHAVRRFVHENQGLMRRMYGDERHISVLRAELDDNEIEYFHDALEKDEFQLRYSKNLASTLLQPEARKLEKTKKAISGLGKNNINAFGDLSKSTPLLTLKPEVKPTKATTVIAENVTLTTTTASTTLTTINQRVSTTTAAPTPVDLINQIEVSEQYSNVTTMGPSDTEATEAETAGTTQVDVEVTTEEFEVEEEEENEQELYEDSGDGEEETEESDADFIPSKPASILRLKGM